MTRRALFRVGALGGAGLAAAALPLWWRRRPRARVERVHLSGSLSREVVPAGEATELWSVLTITVGEDPGRTRAPVDVALVLDTSGSMEGEAIAAARTAARELIDSLGDGDRLAVIGFDSRARVVVPCAALDDEARERAREAVEEIVARGTTALADGLDIALSELVRQSSGESGRVRRVVLLSDGVPNDATPIAGTVSRCRDAGVTITALGLGLEHDETLLGTIAQQTGGTFHFLEEPAALVQIFRDENRRLQGVVARELTLTLTAGPAVELREVVGHAVATGQRELALNLGELSECEERTVVVRLGVGPHTEGAAVELLDAFLSYQDPETSARYELEGVYQSARAVEGADGAALLAQAIDPRVEREIENARAGALTLEAVSLSRAGNHRDAQVLLQANTPALTETAERLGDERLHTQLVEMGNLANTLTNTAPSAEEQKSGRRALRAAYGNAVSNFQARRVTPEGP